MPLAGEMGIGVIVMRPVGNGLLIRNLEREPDLEPLREFGIETWGQGAHGVARGRPQGYGAYPGNQETGADCGECRRGFRDHPARDAELYSERGSSLSQTRSLHPRLG